MKILITGSHGLVGSALMPFLLTAGHKVYRLIRSEPKNENEIYWDPKEKKIDTNALDGFDAVVHLAGESISSKRWTKEEKNKIYHSRVEGTKLLCEALTQATKPPGVFVSASAVGYYGDRRQDEILTEESPKGNLFLSDVVEGWEQATKVAEEHGIRVVNARFGLILSPRGGALEKMLPVFKLGIGGKIGKGNQPMSWIAIDDVLAGIYHVIQSDQISGPVNFVSPQPVTNYAFVKALGQILHRPTVLTVPGVVVKTLFGEMGEELLLAGQRVEPQKLLKSGFQFHYPEITMALEHVLGKEREKV